MSGSCAGLSTKRPAGAKWSQAMNVSDFRGRLNLFLHRQTIRKLTKAEIALAQEWCMEVIRREHPEMSPDQAERYYENLIHIRVIAVDEWTVRMS